MIEKRRSKKLKQKIRKKVSKKEGVEMYKTIKSMASVKQRIVFKGWDRQKE